jgi:SAM-dependent methyltransferase
MKTNIEIEKVKEYYDKNVIGKLKGFVYGNKRVEIAWVEIHKWLSNPSNILEIGCGIGDISWRLSERYPAAQVLGFDVSTKSIDIAKCLFKCKNILFLQADDISGLETDARKFDVIVMMDVYEHIPIDLRENIFEFIRANTSEESILFISCPTVAHQNYLKKNSPSGIQPVDEDITIKEVVEVAEKTGLPLLFYKEVSVWNSGDYLHAVFGRRKYRPVLESTIEPHTSFNKKIREKLKRKSSEIDSNLRLVRENLDVNLVKAVEHR